MQRVPIANSCCSIYTVVLTNRLTSTISGDVPPALIGAGLPATSIEGYMTAVAAGSSNFSSIVGVTPEVQAAGAIAYREAYLGAYHTIFYVSIAFGALGVICNVLVPNIDKYMTNAVAAKLHEGAKTQVVDNKEAISHGAH
jgi:hypothetical protein